ncbi:unnamed protein product [Pleuronectes platessa]|uniref:Apical junction molecule ajm1 alpha/beta domain-containing protein n=1 Tax=Pleuronectes platessa TaxID=8262 RepID=A0A9N7TPY1_PLEPL|nr:unnamed protein product [Pleuronectes platessa]
MEYPYKRAEHQTLNKDVMWNGLDQQGHLRFSSPDLFNTRQFQQQNSHEKNSHLTWSDSKKRTRSKSAPRVKTTLTPVPISVSPPGARKGREAPQAASDTLRTSETPRESYTSNRAFLNEVHPIKLQPHSPLYVSDCFEEEKPEKPAVTPHVRCRVDIKPDASVLQHTSRQVPNVRTEHLWQRYSQASSSRGLYVPRHIVSSPTPTPSECYSGDFRQGYHYTTSMSPISYQHLDTHRMPSPTPPYLSQEQRAYSNPNIPTKFFYTEDPVRSPRRYAALSLSENSLERGSSSPWRNIKSGNWFVTPEITITDNDISAANSKRRDVHSVRWDMSDAEKTSSSRILQQKQPSTTPDITKDRKHNNFSLQQSLEQLDELLADLVVDYKPPTCRKSSVDLLDQLKQLITGDDDKDIESSGLESLGCLNTQQSSKSSPDTIKDPDSGCDALQRSAEECSPDHSTDDDDTMVCANKKCNRIETMFNACLYYKSCHSCYTFYCSRNCRRDNWETHKETCLYGRVSSVCRHILKFCRESSDIHKAFSRVAKAGYLSRGRGVLFLGFANPDTADNFLQVGLESLLMSPTYLSLRELDGFKDNLGEYCKELQQAGNDYDPNECFLLNVSIAVGELVPNRPSPRVQAPTVRKYAKVSLASSSPDKKIIKKDSEMETLILTPPPGTPDIDKEGEAGRKAREVCFVNIQRELRTRGVFLRHEYPKIYNQLCEFVESNKRFTPTTIYPIDRRTGKQFMCMIMAASEPRTLDWLVTPEAEAPRCAKAASRCSDLLDQRVILLALPGGSASLQCPV